MIEMLKPGLCDDGRMTVGSGRSDAQMIYFGTFRIIRSLAKITYQLS